VWTLGILVFFQVFVGPDVWLYLLAVTKPSQSTIYIYILVGRF